ncbi:MAG: alpha-L-arabinofuranosidase C-terminal domain-containing protein [Candidatus Limnocylindrales bacterium]
MGKALPVTEASVIVDDQPSGTISARLYGHFAEHLGRCCYGGLWAGRDALVPTVDGFRADVLAALRELPVPLLRWPGGCYADHYHWRNGIGAPATRPTTLGMSCGLRVPDDNALGTHEFMRLCELLEAEPYLAGNVGTGSVQELCDWIEYVNGTIETRLTSERVTNGRRDPWAVRLWGIGNESWDCGGRFDPVSYAHEFLRYATMVRHVDPRVELVAVGLRDDDLPEMGMDPEWNAKFLAALGPAVDLVDHLSIHRYWVHGGPETTFDESDYYALLEEAAGTESLIQRTARTLAAAAKPTHPISIALDEWGVWHPEARSWGPGDVPRRTPTTFEQANTLRDALAVGIALEGFHRQCRVLSMANLAQVVNVLQAVVMTDGPVCVRTPTYHALALHRAHMGADALQVEIRAGESRSSGQPALSATASTRGEGIAVTLINRDIERATVVSIRAAGTVSSSSVLTADSPNAVNTPADPDRVSPRALAVESQGPGSCVTTLPPHSMATIEFAARGARQP